MEVRSILSPGSSLHLRRGNEKSTPETWNITGFVGEGGECVCYTALSGSKAGRLKEHHPLDALGRPMFQRSPDGVLSADSPLCEEQCAQFCRAYELLEDAKRSEGGALLNNFIPPYELLYGEGGTVYVWTPDDKQGLSFEQYLSEVRSQPSEFPEHKLYNIIRTISTLADCISVLHRAGLLHLDIKPSNFLVLYDGEFNINPSGISLFDVNTLYPIGSSQSRPAGTKNYCAPEVCSGRGENRSDIYSLGAMLLRAVVFSEDGHPLDYAPTDYEQLDTIIAEAPLIRASESNSNVFLRHTLAHILKKCLAFRPAKRYSCCEELIADLEKAGAFLLPEVAGASLGLGKRLAVLDTEPHENRSSAAIMHDLLFRCPIERNLAPDETEIRVLVLGTGAYGQKFMDICLQAGQLPGRRLSIRAFSRSPELDREVYLHLRPALPEFVNVCGSLEATDSYADLDFCPESVNFSAEDSNAEAVRSLLRHYEKALPHFVFVSLGDDELNEKAAEAIVKALSVKKAKCDVHYVLQSERISKIAGASPVYVNAPLSAKAIDPRLEKWAFNAHLCWMGSDAIDLALAKKQFRRKYNLESSLAYALSLTAKLRAVGIDETDPEKAAAAFSEKLSSDAGEASIGKLIALEHRRWVLEKVCSGWRRPRKKNGETELLGGILRGDMKDSRRHLHPCIVRSSEAMPLKSFSGEMWDSPGPWDKQLDELDRLSVNLHRLCLQRTAALREGAALGELSLIRRRIAPYGEKVLRPFERYRACLQKLLKGEKAASTKFDSCENALISALAPLEQPLRDELMQKLRLLRRDFFPAIWSLMRRDYKQSDEELIRRIPFVLTYSPTENEAGSIWDDESPASTADYIPSPIPTDDVELPRHLIELTERIAENVHDVWAAERQREGWLYGEYRDSELKTTPDLVPYDKLPEGEKEYDRKTALETLKLIIKLGYRIERSGE